MRAMLFVKDLRRLTEFYNVTLGLKIVEETRLENWVEFVSGSTRFSLHAIPPEDAETIRITTPPTPREQSPVKLSFEVPDESAALQRLESLGVTILDRPWGGREVVDPEGNVFALY